MRTNAHRAETNGTRHGRVTTLVRAVAATLLVTSFAAASSVTVFPSFRILPTRRLR